ncbi:hypothetical protein MLD38_018545 [Melastoma candidum]|uniref:Uncharacterized protein n=1 Tax=Melastoma candidum TaxID=119954 RepID=A0ACB9QUC0_9MYRT|nr:hypothetical protein MLD38_018545 [Melastoma candidum]
MVSVVQACAKLGSLHRAKEVDGYIREMNVARNVIVDTAMIDMFAKCGSIELAKEIFDSMRVKNVISWSAMIAAYGYHGRGTEALGLFPMMLASGVTPNEITYVSLLYACSHSGLVDDGLRIFSSMKNDYSLKPDVSHYTCMVDLLGRAGKLDEALKLIEESDIDKDQGLWGALLGACRIHKNTDLAERAVRSLLEMKSDNPGHYVLLSNIYANAGRWDEVARVRGLMTQRKLKKLPGWTWVEVNGEVHRFGTSDGSHPRSKEIYSFLNSLLERLEAAGYVPDTDFALHDVDEEVKKGTLSMHSEKLALAYSLLATPEGTPIRMTKNLRICGDCHSFVKFASAVTERAVVMRDASRFHHFQGGTCSCNNYW